MCKSQTPLWLILSGRWDPSRRGVPGRVGQLNSPSARACGAAPGLISAGPKSRAERGAGVGIYMTGPRPTDRLPIQAEPSGSVRVRRRRGRTRGGWEPTRAKGAGAPAYVAYSAASTVVGWYVGLGRQAGDQDWIFDPRCPGRLWRLPGPLHQQPAAIAPVRPEPSPWLRSSPTGQGSRTAPCRRSQGS